MEASASKCEALVEASPEHMPATCSNGPEQQLPFVQVEPWTNAVGPDGCGPARPPAAQPRPTYGIVVAITVANCTFASNGNSAMCRTVRATSVTSITGSGTS